MDRLKRYLAGGVSPYHTVLCCEKELQERGFLPLSMTEPWKLKENGRYYIKHHGTALFAFVLPGKKNMTPEAANPVLRIACAHTDYPCLRIKPKADLYTGEYHKLNAEVYGGAILNTWMDRPLGIAGRVILRSKETFAPEELLYDSARPLLTIPNLAIHMNREVNKGIELNKQVDLIPLFGMKQDQANFLDFLAEELGRDAADILDYDLTVYVAEEPTDLGRQGEFISSPRIDNISSVAAIMDALCQENLCQEKKEPKDGGCCVKMAAFFDHEEIGSRTKQGAQSAMLTDIIEKLYESLGFTLRDAKDAIYQGMMLSVDVAHGLHPNHPEKQDVTNQPVLNGGFCIKEAASQSYATDCAAVGIVEQLAGDAISYQKFVNRSDMPGGSTLGALSGALLPMKVVDIGIPILAMHSAREVMGERDEKALLAIISEFWRKG